MKDFSLQHSLNQWLNVDYNTSTTIIITIFVFFNRLLMTGLIREINLFLERKRTRNIYNYNFQNLKQSVAKQSTRYLKYYESLAFNNVSGFDFSNVLIPSPNIFKKIGYENIYKAYFLGFENVFQGKKSLKAFEKLWSSITAIPIWQNEMKIVVENQIENFNEWNELRNKSLAEFYKNLDPLITKHINSTISEHLGKFLKELDTVQFNYQTNPNLRNPEIVQEEMVQPTLEVNRKY